MAGARSNNGLAFTHTVMHWPHVQQNPARTSCRHRRPPVADRSGTHEAASGSQLPPAGVLLPAIPALPGRAGWRSSLAPWARCRSAKVFRLMQVTNHCSQTRRAWGVRRVQKTAPGIPGMWGDVPARSAEQDQKHQKKRNRAQACLEQQSELASADRRIDQFHDALPFFLVRSPYRMNEDRSSKSCIKGTAAA